MQAAFEVVYFVPPVTSSGKPTFIHKSRIIPFDRLTPSMRVQEGGTCICAYLLEFTDNIPAVIWDWESDTWAKVDMAGLPVCPQFLDHSMPFSITETSLGYQMTPLYLLRKVVLRQPYIFIADSDCSATWRLNIPQLNPTTEAPLQYHLLPDRISLYPEYLWGMPYLMQMTDSAKSISPLLMGHTSWVSAYVHTESKDEFVVVSLAPAKRFPNAFPSPSIWYRGIISGPGRHFFIPPSLFLVSYGRQSSGSVLDGQWIVHLHVFNVPQGHWEINIHEPVLVAIRTGIVTNTNSWPSGAMMMSPPCSLSGTIVLQARVGQHHLTRHIAVLSFE